MKPVCAVIFDLDGVLTHTSEFHYRAWKRVADEEGIAFDRTRNAALRGVSREESLRRLLDGQPIEPARFDGLLARKNDYFRALIGTLGPTDLSPGAAALLNGLRNLHIKLAVGSSSRNGGYVIDRLGIRAMFDAVIDGAAVENTKPSPDIFLLAAEQVRIAPGYCVVVEDSAAGLQGAFAAGMRAVAFGSDVADCEAHVHLESFKSLAPADFVHRCTVGRRAPGPAAYGAAPTVR